jgi:molybdopterin synthase catalytic subunit
MEEPKAWTEVTSRPLPVAEVLAWATVPSCGGLAVFVGTVRDHAEGRPGVVRLEYEAYQPAAQSALVAIATEARHRWPEIGRIALVHRTGPLAVGEASVVVAVCTPHRAEAFAAARWCIDTLKESVPIWKREAWADGEAWATDAHPLREVGSIEGSGR